MTETSEKVKSGSGARETVLASIRENLAASHPFDAHYQKHHGCDTDRVQPIPGRWAELSADTLIDNFRTNLEAVGGNFALVKSESEMQDKVLKVVKKMDATRIANSNSELVQSALAEMESVANASVEFLFDCDLGVTSAQWGIAETGTLVLESDVENHRLISLVPPVHLCLVRGSTIRQTMGEILELTSRRLSRTVTFITGASRTSDIELTLAIGVHGPRELHVIVIADE